MVSPKHILTGRIMSELGKYPVEKYESIDSPAIWPISYAEEITVVKFGIRCRCASNPLNPMKKILKEI